MKKALVFDALRTGYSIDQVDSAMTVGDLRAMLEDMEDDTLIICSHDNGYTYGSLSRCASFCEERESEDEDGSDSEWEETDILYAWR